MKQQERFKYLENLNSSKIKFEKMHSDIPMSMQNKHMRWRVKSDLDQVQWRIDYLN